MMRSSARPQPTEWCSVAQGGPMLHHPSVTWLGKTGDYGDPRNYSGGKMPGHGDTLIIPPGTVCPEADTAKGGEDGG